MSDVTNRITLSVPISKAFRGPEGERTETIAEVTVRSPVAGDLRVMDAEPGQMGKVLALGARLTGLDARTFDQLAFADFTAISKVVEGFMPDGLLTGSTG